MRHTSVGVGAGIQGSANFIDLFVPEEHETASCARCSPRHHHSRRFPRCRTGTGSITHLHASNNHSSTVMSSPLPLPPAARVIAHINAQKAAKITE